ncbi:MAG: ATP synthase F1 subunit delta [Sumerlaeia bacterium]
MHDFDPAAIKPYALALFGAAKGQGVLQDVAEQARELAQGLEATPAARVFLQGPHLPTDDKVAYVNKVAADRFPVLLKNFLLLLIRKNRMGIIIPVLKEVYRLYQQEQGMAQGSVTTPKPLSDDEKQRLQETLENYTGQKLNLHYVVNDKMIGGIVFKSGDLLIDSSLTGKLSKLREKLLHAKVA